MSQLLNATNIKKKNYTFEEWRGIRPGDYMYDFSGQQENDNRERRRMNFVEDVKEFCGRYHMMTQSEAEPMLNFWQFQFWFSQLADAIKRGDNGNSERAAGLFFASLFGVPSQSLHTKFNRNPCKINGKCPIPLTIITNFLTVDLGLTLSLGLGFRWEKRNKADEHFHGQENKFHVNHAIKHLREGQGLEYCPVWMKIAERVMPGQLNEDAD
eukprot:114815_1